MKLPKILFSKKILFIIPLFIFLFVFIRQALAYTPSEDSSTYTDQFNQGLDSSSWEKSSFDFTTINNVMESLSTSIVGTGEESLDQKLGPSALGTTSNLIAGLYQKPPASSIEYFADLGKRLQITKTAYAQGIGFEGLSPTLDIWRAFRNAAYLIFAIILVFIGLAVMFRLKINPQTVINIQSALPKIVIALILVTFSYAIAGLLIDLIYVFISFFAAIIGQTDIAYNQNLFGAASNMFGGLWKGAANNMGLAVRQFVIDLLGGGLRGKILGYPVGSLVKLIFAVAILVSLFKVFFSLLIAYISIIAGVIFSPWLLMLEAIPGQKGLMNWLRMMLTNIAPFPIVAIIFMIGSKLVASAATASPDQTIWVAPFLGTGSTQVYIPTIIGVAILLATPTVIASVQKSIGTPGIAGMAGGIIAPITAAWGFMKGVSVGAVQLGKQGWDMSGPGQARRVEMEANIKDRAQQLYEKRTGITQKK